MCRHAGTALKLLTAPLPVNQEEGLQAGVHVPLRVVAKAERMRAETAQQVLQAVIDHPRIASVLELSHSALEQQLQELRSGVSM